MNKEHNVFRHQPSREADREARDAALAKAMEVFGEHMIRFFTRAIGDPHRAEELASALWVHVYETFDIARFQDVGLLYYAARQYLGRELRRRAARSGVKLVELRVEEHDRISPRKFESEDDERRIKEEFWEIFEGAPISEKQKEAFWLLNVHGLTITELSARFRVSRSTIHEWIDRLQQDCREHFKGR